MAYQNVAVQVLKEFASRSISVVSPDRRLEVLDDGFEFKKTNAETSREKRRAGKSWKKAEREARITTTRPCRHCGKPFSFPVNQCGTPPRYCSGSCRSATYKAKQRRLAEEASTSPLRSEASRKAERAAKRRAK